MRHNVVRIGPAKAGDPLLGLLMAPFGLLLIWWAGKAAVMPYPNDRAYAIWFAVAGVALIALALWMAAKGVTGRVALRLEDGALVVERLRPVGADVVIPTGQIVALHHGGLGDKHPVIRVEYALPNVPGQSGHVKSTKVQTKIQALPRHGFCQSDEAVLQALCEWLEAGGARLEEKSGVPVFGRHSWVVAGQMGDRVT